MVAPIKAESDGIALEDLFADEKPRPEALKLFADHHSPVVMKMFYDRLLPWKLIYLWLNQDTQVTKHFTHREIALELPGEVYVRYQSWAKWEDMKKDMVRQIPNRFEVGPVYSGKPKDRKTLLKANFKPYLRELVFDIDMTDYDSIRTCCSDKAMCKRCWRFISMAVKVLERVLREDFGFNHLLWVYSGRRGIHCWVSDKAAMALSDDQRRAIVNYIEVIKGGAKMDKKVDLRRPLHPSIDAALASLKTEFAQVILRDQDCFAKQEQWELLLRLLPDQMAAKKLATAFPPGSDASSTKRWEAVLTASTKDGTIATEKYHSAIQDIVLQYTYPRIDTEVSKHLNHLLKSPFCIHPGTGRVCVPLKASEVDAFDPDACPNVSQLLEELEELARTEQMTQKLAPEEQSKRDSEGWAKFTSLKPFVRTFEEHVDGLLKESLRERKELESVKMEF